MRKKVITITAVVIVLAIIIFVIASVINKEDDYKDMSRWDLDITNINNDISSLSLKKGIKVNIYINVPNINDDELKNAYIENVEIINLRNSQKEITNNISDAKYIEFKIPLKYYSLTSSIVTLPTISYTLEKSDNKSAMKFNEKIYKFLEDNYSIPKDEE